MTATVTIMGNLTDDPELRFTRSGKAVASMTVAVNERVKDGDTWVDSEPSYFDVKAWERLGENSVENLKRGTRVVVVGRLKIEKYETKEGQQRQKPVITAEDIAESVKYRGAAAPARRVANEPPVDDIPPF